MAQVHNLVSPATATATGAHAPGVKLDAGKPRMELVFGGFAAAIKGLQGFPALYGHPVDRLLAGVLRHLAHPGDEPLYAAAGAAIGALEALERSLGGAPGMGVGHDMALALPRAFLAVGQVATFGAQKYSDGGWRTVPDGVRRYRDAAYRHLLKSRIEECDEESGLPHLAHLAWNMLAVLELSIAKERGE
ncbi:dATP/dGTP diphosphohydrolase domain-containing protein [Sinimarinibacterium sp. NLF-5-8]|uniref:dATP/dGTP diphosphohydrolase domain-containing protein n=1 Tax=Sinimarinibacterium sp. NLF-5-8 TaxID=2698684 RepID=UPI00137C235B|nr:dATP/dGTP diphosphohydrolase domain-containing protein [Sinimarinibacterium sp. NLF-5-8]QHS09150.1 hypothetical protein GT972_02585 [Sinimarinibacterium sp. NLF-5-8]